MHRYHSHRVNVGSLTDLIITQGLLKNPQHNITTFYAFGDLFLWWSASDPEQIKIMRLKNIIRVNLINGVI